MNFDLIKDDNIIEVHNHLKKLICKNENNEFYIDTSEFRLSDYRELTGAFERMGFDENLLKYFEEELIHNKTNISESEFQILIGKYFDGIDLEKILSLCFEKRAILKPLLLNIKMKLRTVTEITTSEVERLTDYLNDLIFDTQISKKNETYSETLNRVSSNLELRNFYDKYKFAINEGENIKKTILNFISEKETDTELEIEVLEFIIKFVSSLKEIFNKISISKEENAHLELKNAKKISLYDDNMVNIFGYKFLVPSFIITDCDELDILLGISTYYSKILGGFLRVDSVCINWKTWNEYETNCFDRNYIPLPLVIEDYYNELDGTGYIIKPFELDILTEKDCDQIFIKYIFEHQMDYSHFLYTQLYENPNPFVFLSKLNSLIVNLQKIDIETLRIKKSILESIETAISEIEYLNNSIQELQSPSLPKKSEEKSQTNQLTWSESKTDLAELVYALAKTQRIKSSTTGKTATKEELLKYFSEQFGQDITDQSLLTNSKGTYKKTNDLNTFTRKLADIFDTYLKK